MQTVNLIYFGSPEFSAQILEDVLHLPGIQVVGVVTTPDKPTGRQKVMTPSPVAKVAEKYDLPIFKPQKLDDNNLSHLKLLKPDYFLVVSYGKIIPTSWLNTVEKSLNLHFSLLPRYRGALCRQEALKNGDQETGVTLMEMSEGLDTGPIISQIKVEITLNDDVATLTEKLTTSAITLLKSDLIRYFYHDLTATPQTEAEATLTPSYKTLTHASSQINESEFLKAIEGLNALKVHNLIRSLNPEPGAWLNLNGLELKILKTTVVDQKLVPLVVLQNGKKEITWKQYLAGHPLNR